MLRAQPLLSSAELVELGLRPRAQRRKQVAKPADAPSLTVLDCRCGVVELLVRDRDNDSRKARPADTEGVLVLFNKGEKPDAGGWTLLTVSGSTRLRLELPPGIEPGERLWLTAGWLGTRKQSGPFAAPISVHVIPGAIRSRPSLSLAA